MKVALVTGGAKRVGRAIVERLAESDFDVAFTYLSSDSDAGAMEKRLRSKGRAGFAIQADLTQPESAAVHIHTEFTRRFKRLDLLVNNASLYQPATLQKTSMHLVRQLMAIHVQVPLLLCQRF